MGYKSSVAIRIAVSLSFLVVIPGVATAQFRAAIQGTMLDTSAGVIPGATVTVTSQETNVTRETVTGDTGTFRVSCIGSRSIHRKGLARGVPGESCQRCRRRRRRGARPRRNSGAERRSGVGDRQLGKHRNADGERRHLELADAGRRFSRCPRWDATHTSSSGWPPVSLDWAPGTQPEGRSGCPHTQGPGGSNDQIFATENRPGITAAGQRVEANNIQIDGVNAMSQAWGGAAVVTPNQESVKEVRVLANNYTAEFGRNTGAQIQVVSQTGTNDFHGSLFAKRNTPGLNAFQNFDKAGTALQRRAAARQPVSDSMGRQCGRSDPEEQALLLLAPTRESGGTVTGSKVSGLRRLIMKAR